MSAADESSDASPASHLITRIAAREAEIGVIGMGYVGLPLAAACARAGFPVTGFDIDPEKVALLNEGRSYIDAVPTEELTRHHAGGKFRGSADFAELGRCDVIVICVPTPLSHHRDPDLRYVEATARAIAATLRTGQLVVLESTTYPGTTDEVVKPILEAGGLKSGRDFFLAFSPEREDPGRRDHSTATIPKVFAGDGEAASDVTEAFYSAVVERTVRVSTPAVAEASKITENIFRAVNIALVNELKVIYDAMGIDVWEVIDAAATKPFGFMPFYPGPGLGGHCIPIDPFYLTWKSRAYGLNTRFIELAGEVNAAMPAYVIARLERELDMRAGVSLSRARLLLVGLAYKKNVPDIRESPALEIMQTLKGRGSAIDYHDPHVPEIPRTREHADLAGRRSVELTATAVAAYDAVLVVTDHDAVDYALLAEHGKILLDTRNAFRKRGLDGERIVRT